MTLDERISTVPEPITSKLTRYSHSRHLVLESANGTYGGLIRDKSPTVIDPNLLIVERDKRGQGIGESLVRRLIVEARKQGVETIRGHIESEYALDIRARIFGEEALKFYYDKPKESKEKYPEQYVELPITFTQARESLVRARSYEDDLESRDIGFIVEVDISEFEPKQPSPELFRPVKKFVRTLIYPRF